MADEVPSTLKFFSLNGPDNVGKTTQMNMIPKHWNISHMSSIHKYHDGLCEMHDKGTLRQWWFGVDNSTFVRVIHEALLRRLKFAKEESQHAAFDRGAIMFQAVCTARIAQCDKVNVLRAKKKFEQMLESIGISWPTEFISICMLHTEFTESSVKNSLRATAESDQTYISYQVLLQEALREQIRKGDYTKVIVRGDKSCLQVHEEICEALRQEGGPQIWTPLLHRLSCLVGFGGMSEAGKSSIASKFVLHHKQSAARLKVGYLMQLAARGNSALKHMNVYDLPEGDQALAFVHEIDAFAHAHYWLKFISVESLHNFAFTKELKRVLGPVFRIAFIVTEESTRLAREGSSIEEFKRKDLVKRTRGAHLVEGIADLVINNDGKLSDSVEQLLHGLGSFVE